ncbi:PREDICTED: uncharacterized protein LOC109581083 [Amphimedon queenslandica]|uniref:IgGFc-binding protein N-terminal domain-containing protein n=1 Tax=Amphimedon queenslandica TaxID=400682 RepID=A0A1X7V660_AMPQE|nr:PREDICTED: uncharacterized protein LOC109581083 [Amphimedon queenslandica]|eukprot:XP_019850414.1 PREDICTED: uncharacterized protein LOC109581083 [Amphimedon queenslandica]
MMLYLIGAILIPLLPVISTGTSSGKCFEGFLTAFDANISHQTVFVDNGSVHVEEVQSFLYDNQVLPLTTSYQLTKDNITYVVSKNTILMINSTRYKPIELTCNPLSITFGPESLNQTIIYGLCPGVIFRIELSPSHPPTPQYFHLRQMSMNFNGTIMFDSHNALHFLTGIGSFLYIKIIRSGESAELDVPSCRFVTNIKIVSGNFMAIFCADSHENSSIITSVHFRNLSIENYVSVHLDEPIERDILTVNSLDNIVLLTDSFSLHIIDRVNGNYKLLDTKGSTKIADTTILSSKRAYYITSSLAMFSPNDVLNGIGPSSQANIQACGPPTCAPSLGTIDNKGIVYSRTETSIELRDDDGDCHVVIPLKIKAKFYVHNLTLHSTEQASPSSSTGQVPHEIVIPVIVFVVLSGIALFVGTVIAVSVKKSQSRKRTSFSIAQESVQDNGQPGKGIQESGECIQEQGQSAQECSGTQESTTLPNYPVQQGTPCSSQKS